MIATITSPTMPPLRKNTNAAPTKNVSATKSATRKNVLRLFAAICSYTNQPGIVEKSELDLGNLGRALLGLEVFALLEVEHARDEVRWEGLNLRVELLHAVVVELPRVRNAILGRGQLFLQIQEVLIRLEVGVVLRQREPLAQGTGEHVLGLCLLRGAGLLRLDRAVAGLHDFLERLALVGGVALDRLDEVRDQIVATLELHSDLRPRRIDPVPQPDDAVVGQDEEQHRQHDDGQDHDHGYRHRATSQK